MLAVASVDVVKNNRDIVGSGLGIVEGSGSVITSYPWAVSNYHLGHRPHLLRCDSLLRCAE